MGRPEGIPNKRSQMLLRKLEDDHNFHVIRELLELYGYSKKLYVPLFNTMIENLAAEKPMMSGMSAEEIDLFKQLNKELTAVLMRLLTFMYPKLKAMELKHGDGEQIIFNINTIPDVEIKK